MSVKKSLWLSLAVVMAMSLVFLGCPTEASSSSTGERPAYEQTALWEAIIDAQNVLKATPVSDLASLVPPVAPKDIDEKTNYVTAVQAAAFEKAIGEAQSFAYGLRPSIRAIEPTPAEVPALTDLAAAQAQFNAYKELQFGTGVKANTTIAINAVANTNIVITDNVVLEAAVTLAGKYVTIAPGAKLTTSSLAANTFDIGTGELVIKNGGTFEIVSTTKRTTANFTGTITVEAGGTVINRGTEEGYWLSAAGTDTGYYIIKAGGVLISGGSVLVGPTEGANRGQIFQLKSGKITVGVPVAASTPVKYALAGDADLKTQGDANLVGSLPITALAVDGTLTVADKVDLSGVDATTGLLTSTTVGSKIILAGTGSYITILDSGSAWAAFTTTSAVDGATVNTKVEAPLSPWVFGGGGNGSTPPFKPYHSGHINKSGFRLTGPVILQNTSTTSTPNWISQK